MNEGNPLLFSPFFSSAFNFLFPFDITHNSLICLFRFLPFSLEQGVMIQSQPFVTSLQPVHSFKVERCSITFSRKSVKIYHYVISNKSEKTTELLLEHPKEWDKPVGSVSLIVEECYHGTDKEKEKNKIDVKTEYPVVFFFLCFF